MTSEQYTQPIADFLQAYYAARKWDMQEGFGLYDLPILTAGDLEKSPLAQQLRDLARAAAGELDQENESLRGEIYEGCQDLVERLFAVPGMLGTYRIQPEFWQTEIGEMVARALLWARGDTLITIADAAQIRGVTVQAISAAVTAGRLRGYVDPDAGARQGRTLVSRQDVEALGD